ncbi:MAG: MTH1187 family thiamine-binding protein [Dehalococcoidia bacterium]|nr:MTH1187 family thiamine-binding protein [Dehalococcoidia bacterium]
MTTRKAHNVIAEVSIVPIGTASTSLSSYVAGCVAVLENARKVKYQLTPMGTIIEGRLKDVITAVLKMHEVPFTAGIARVVTTIKIDDRRDKEATMEAKVKSVLAKRQKSGTGGRS